MFDGCSRREFVRRGAGFTALFCASRFLPGCASPGRGEGPPDPQDPIDESPDFARAIRAGAFAFAPGFTGDAFDRPHEALVDRKDFLARRLGGRLPPVNERARVVIVGGGLSGLAAAHELRDLSPVVLEQDPRFGGNAKGERWRDAVYATGAAYFIRPDEGDDLDRFYASVGIKGAARLLEGHDPVEYRGRIFEDFFSGEAEPAAKEAYRAYAARMERFEEEYPDIPILDEEAREAVLALDRRSLADEVTEWLGGKVPPSLQAAIQNYCWSSLGAGWREVSAAAGINFLAGEAFGVLALPGGNGALTRAIYRRLRAEPGRVSLRGGCLAFDVSPSPGGVRVSYLDPAGAPLAIEAGAVVLACPKFVAKSIVPGIEAERARADAIAALRYRGYLVVNLLVKRALPREFYDLYLLRDGAIVESAGGEGRAPGRITDAILGTWARRKGPGDHSVLTLYWPLPFESGREEILLARDSFERLRPLAERQILELLPLLDLRPSDVEQVRMTRWGHALPVASVGFLAAGHADALCRPMGDRIFFVNQDNWALPAVETSLTEALRFAPEVRARVV